MKTDIKRDTVLLVTERTVGSEAEDRISLRIVLRTGRLEVVFCACKAKSLIDYDCHLIYPTLLIINSV